MRLSRRGILLAAVLAVSSARNVVRGDPEPLSAVPERGVNFAYPVEMRDRIRSTVARAVQWLRKDAVEELSKPRPAEVEDAFGRGTLPMEAVGANLILCAAALAQHGSQVDEKLIVQVLDTASLDLVKHRASARGTGWDVHGICCYLYLAALYYSVSDPFDAPIDSYGRTRARPKASLRQAHAEGIRHAVQELVDTQVRGAERPARNGAWGHGRANGLKPLPWANDAYVSAQETQFALLGLASAELVGAEVPLRPTAPTRR